MATTPLPVDVPLTYAEARPLKELIDIPTLCSHWSSAYVKEDLDGIVIYYNDVEIELTGDILTLASRGVNVFSLALEGLVRRRFRELDRREFMCLLRIVTKLASKRELKAYEEKLGETLRTRTPTFSMVLAKTIVFALQERLVGKLFVDAASDITYVKVNGKWFWGSEAESYLEKMSLEVGYELVDNLASQLNVDTLRAQAALTTNVISESVKQLKLWSTYPSDEIATMISSGNRFIHYDAGYLEVDSWFNKGVLKKHSDIDAIVIHKLPQEEFELDALNGRFEDLYDIERIAEQFTPTLLDAMRQWVPDPDQRLNLWLAMGYSVYPKLPIRAFFLLLGPTGSGKSTFLDFLAKAIGWDNFSAVSLQQLLSSRWEYYVAELYNKLINIGDEGINSSVLEKRAKSMELLKALVGGSFITARGIYSRPFRFVNHAKLFFATNDERVVEILKQDPAVANRMVVIHFQGSFRDNYHFKERLLREAPKALPVMLAALRVLAKTGFTKEKINEEDKIIEKLKELCEKSCIERSSKGDLFITALLVRKELGLSAKELCALLRRRGILCSYAKANGGRRGVALPRSFLER